MATYQSTFGPGEVGGVDHNGHPHEPLVFDDDGLCTVPDDQQEYAQTLRNLLQSGQVSVAKSRKPKETS